MDGRKIPADGGLYLSRTKNIHLGSLDIEVDIGDNHFFDLGFFDNIVRTMCAVVPEICMRFEGKHSLDDIVEAKLAFYSSLRQNSGVSNEEFTDLMASEKGSIKKNGKYYSCYSQFLGSECSYVSEQGVQDLTLWFGICRKSSPVIDIKSQGYIDSCLLKATGNFYFLEGCLAKEGIDIDFSDLSDSVLAGIGCMYALYRAGCDVFSPLAGQAINPGAIEIFKKAVRQKGI